MIDEKRIKRFIEAAKEAFKEVDDPTFTFPMNILSAYELATSIEELLKAQEARVMAIEELEETEEPVFIELKTKSNDEEVMTCFGLLSEWDNLAFHFIIDQWLLNGKPFFKIYGCELKRKEYNIQWRPWNKLPTIKQMKSVKWE